jgi:hypothetical protein
MKTNQVLKVKFSNGELTINHKDKFGSLIELFQIGNDVRVQNGLPSIRHDKWLALSGTKEFIKYVSEDIGEPATRSKRGKGGGIWAHLLILLDTATYLHPSFKFEVLNTFVDKKMLEWRDRSGDNYVDLSAAIALSAEDVFGKPAHNGHYINIARILRNRILGEDEVASLNELKLSPWNQCNATQLAERARIEEALATMLKAGVVKDWEHLKELAKIV